MKAILIFFLLSAYGINAQPVENISVKKDTSFSKNEFIYELQTISERRKQIKSLMVPLTLITYGLVSLDNENLQSLDRSIKEEIRENNPLFHTNVDNYLQYAPAVVDFGLNLIRIKRKNNFRDRKKKYLLFNVNIGVKVQSLKAIINI